MKSFARFVLLIVISTFGAKTNCSAKNFKKLQEVHKKISDELIGIRKDFSATQPRIYSLLDQLDSFKRIAEEIRTKKISFKNKYSELNQNVTLLTNKNLELKNKLKLTTDELEKAFKKITQEQQFSNNMKKEIASLHEEKKKREELEKEKIVSTNINNPLSEEKIITPENILNNQSFNLTSSSEPISPR